MKTKILEKALKIINDRHYEANNEAQHNKTQAFKDETFKSIYLRYVEKMIADAKENIVDDENLKKLQKQYQSRLSQLKIGDVEPNYHCKTCDDSGFKEGHYCDCLIEEINNILKLESGFLSLEDFDDANFEIFKDKEFIQRLYAVMKKWCYSNFEKSLVFLSGQTGVGKTHLMKCMANELIKTHKIVLLTTSFAMHQDFVKSYACRDNEEKQDLISKYIDAEVLFIDDLGTELRQPNITVNYLYQVLNERKMKKRPTIITTNLNLDDIMDYYDERIFSRIADKSSSICVYIEGQDLRLLNK